jgi:hypothetical protein
VRGDVNDRHAIERIHDREGAEVLATSHREFALAPNTRPVDEGASAWSADEVK